MAEKAYLQKDPHRLTLWSVQMGKVIALSVPAILAELSSMAMQYIDSAMVGSLGAQASASIGLVSTSTWLLSGLCISIASGFSVQTAQLIGAKREAEARDVLRQSFLVALLFGMTLMALGVFISAALPVWLGGDPSIRADASRYFLIYACAMPAVQMRQLSGSMLQCSGNMRTPSILNALMCGLDVVFNGLLIFDQLSIPLLGIKIPGMGLGVAGAAFGTALAEYVTACLMVSVVCFGSPLLRLRSGGSWRLRRTCMARAARIAVPMAFEHSVMCGAQIASTRIVAPLGTVSIAANSLAVTAESLCYMPGYGIATAATTLVGQSIGAGRRDLARRYARLAVLLAVMVMTGMALLMFFLAPLIFSLLTPDAAVQQLGVRVLRIEVFAEPLYAVSIAAAGAMRGAGDTLIPSTAIPISLCRRSSTQTEIHKGSVFT